MDQFPLNPSLPADIKSFLNYYETCLSISTFKPFFHSILQHYSRRLSMVDELSLWCSIFRCVSISITALFSQSLL